MLVSLGLAFLRAFTLDFVMCVSMSAHEHVFISVSCYTETWMECKSFISLDLSLILCMALVENRFPLFCQDFSGQCSLEVSQFF